MKHYNFIVTKHVDGDITIADMRVIDAFAVQAPTEEAAREEAEKYAKETHGTTGVDLHLKVW